MLLLLTSGGAAVTDPTTIDFTLNAREVVTYAFKKLRVKAAGQDITAGELEDGLEELNLMLKGWQMTGPHLFRQTETSLTLVADTASYTISDAYRIVEARLRQDGRDLPMELLTRQEYYDLPLKTSSGIPTCYYYDAQASSGTFYIWPVPASVTGMSIRYTYQRRFVDVDDATDSIDVPQEYLQTVGYSLAELLADTYHMPNEIAGRVIQRAQMMRGIASDAGREPVVRFVPDRR